jgi:hypothetical protein
MKQIAPIAAALVLALTACSGEADAPSEGADVDAAAAEAPMYMPVVIPTQFWGVWDYVEGACLPESDMRMEISGNEILFYESMGTLTGIELEGENSIVLMLAMEGEGERWEQKLRLAFGEDGKTLMPQFFDGDRVYEPMPRQKCN